MAATTRITGASAVVSFAGTSIEGDFTSLDISEEGEIIDVTAGDETARTFVTTNRSSYTVDFEGFYEGTTTIWTAVAQNSEGTLIVGPAGTAAGNPKWTWGSAYVNSRSMSIPFDGAVTVSISFQCSGTKTEGAYP